MIRGELLNAHNLLVTIIIYYPFLYLVQVLSALIEDYEYS